MTAYLAALEQRDAAAIARMVSPGVDATADIAAQLEIYGGIGLSDPRVTYRDDFGGSYVVATVVGRDAAGAARTVTVPLARVGDAYYIALGQMAPSGSEANPSSPSP